ncbi:MAG: nucleotide exchange factor GrpE [Chloroflexi bacterium]|nr:nucleotide exchange factor GrpE [Chloroflexota bacterium]
MAHLLKLFSHWFGQERNLSPAPAERLLELEREAQYLRLSLADREKELAEVQRALERQRAGEEARVNEALQQQWDRLFTEVATPVAQLSTQAHLLETAGQTVQAKDVLAVAKRLVRLLEERGLKIEGNVGETVGFDPNRHEPLSAEAAPALNRPVVVRLVGICYRGHILRKAKVDLL